ncbi:MAG: DoxX family protein [Alphaproteobacteria bacterium]|nr:DoxX family protein [Alphaproteobacteria bacterium]MBV9372284.1 DoxX family protein [Alphaproteobacteria bacterium]MBV9899576.1 DoxX family protein [Alphaproteobacteria bacterium]
MTRSTAPAFVSNTLASPTVSVAARLALASPFAISGVLKLLDFGGATAEVRGLGLASPAFVAGAVVATQILGSMLFLSRRFRWLGAGLLSGFTVFATLLAHAFWQSEGVERAHQVATFLEHGAIVGGLVLAAHLAERP